MQPDISLILQGSKKAIVTDKKLESTELKFLEILDIGISEEKCKKMNIDVSKLVSKEGYIYCGINIGTARKISKSDFYNKRHEFLQFDEWNDDMYYIPILKIKKIPEINYIEKYGEPEEIDGFIFKTSMVFEKDVMGRNIGSFAEFQTPIMTRLKDNTSPTAFRCIFPININPYWGCEHKCLYCYVRYVCGYFGMYTEEAIPSNFEIIRTEMYNGLHTNKDNLLSNLIRKRYPIQIGVNTDPFQPSEEKYEVTYKIIKLLKDEFYPYNIITKNPVIATKDKYLKELSESNVLFHCSIPFFNEEMAKKMETNVPSPKDRIKAIKKLIDNNVHVTVRISPVMIGLNCNIDGTLNGYRYDEFLSELNDVGVDTIMTQAFLRSSVLTRVFKSELGINYDKIYDDRWIRLYGNVIDKKELEHTTYIRYCKEIRKITDKYKMIYSAHCMDFSVSTTKTSCCPLDTFPEEKRKTWRKHGVNCVSLYQLVKEKDRKGEGVGIDDIKKEFNIENWKEFKKVWKTNFYVRKSFNMFRENGKLLLDEDNMTEVVYEFIEHWRNKGNG